MGDQAKYLYCIVRCRQDRAFSVAGMGNNGSLVRTICSKGLAAVTSDTEVKHYESTRKNMMAHEKVLESIMQEVTLLPVRFGTVVESAYPTQDIQKLLDNRAEEFDKLLNDMENKEELSLKAFWRNEKVVFEEIVAESAEIRRLRSFLSDKSPEATHFERIRLGEMVKSALGRKKAEEAGKILPPLRQLARAVRENEVTLDRMVVNAAFLVDKARELEFDGAVDRLDEQFGQRISFKYIGPTPPYNFVNIVVDWRDLK